MKKKTGKKKASSIVTEFLILLIAFLMLYPIIFMKIGRELCRERV